jgi:hypothetical protein
VLVSPLLCSCAPSVSLLSLALQSPALLLQTQTICSRECIPSLSPLFFSYQQEYSDGTWSNRPSRFFFLTNL